MPAAAPTTAEAIARGWSAADVDPAEYVTDEWIAANTSPGRGFSPARHLAQRVVLAARTVGRDPYAGADRLTRAVAGTRTARLPRAVRRALIQTGGLTREQMRRIAARTGYPVVEAWSSWNRGSMSGVWGALIHHTGTPWSVPGDYPTLRTVQQGRSDLQNSLCAFGLGRAGTVYLVSEKLSWHAGAGNWNGCTDGNGHLAGIEAESDGVNWTAEERDAYPRLVASILIEIGQDDRFTTRHASYALPAGRKNDASGLDMDLFWAQVYGYLAHPETITRGGVTPPVPPPVVVNPPAPPQPPAPPVVPALPIAPGWPAAQIGSGYFGDVNGPAASHGGWAAWEKPVVQWIQRKLIVLGFVPGVSDWRSGWADGVWGPATTTAMAAYQHRWLPRTTLFGRCYADDYRYLVAARP